MLLTSNFKLPEDYVIIFNHIPKVGGTSIINFFNQLYGEDKCFRHKTRIPGTDKFTSPIGKLEESKKAYLRFTAGHFKEIGVDELFKKPSFYIGVVRDPVDRFTSDYYYNRRDGSPKLKEITNNLNINEYLQSKLKQKSNFLNNAQMLMLTGETELEKAKQVIENKYLLCCGTKQLDRFIELLSAFYDFQVTTSYRKNVTPSKQKNQALSVENQEIIRDRNEIDVQFCQYIEESFSKKCAQQLSYK